MIERFRDLCMCVYCGEHATDREHVVPKSLGGSWTVPSCRECNSLIGASLQPSLSERRKVIARKVKARYRKVLRVPEWDREEVSELGPILRLAIAEMNEARLIVLERLEFMQRCGAVLAASSQEEDF